MFSSFLLFASTTTATKDNCNSVWHAIQPNITKLKQSLHHNNKKYDFILNVFRCETDSIDDDNDNSSSINNDCFQFISYDTLELFDNIISIP